MPIWQHLRVALVAALAWALLAAGSLAMVNSAGAALLIWVPAGVVVAAFRFTPRQHWPVLAALLLPLIYITMILLGSEAIASIAFTISALAQAAICALISVRILGGRTALPRSARQVVGLFGAAVTGCLAGAMIALPFRAEQTFAEFAYLFLANVLGILIITPMVLHVGGIILRIRRGRALEFDREMTLALLACGSLCFLALRVEGISLMPLLVAAMVAMAVRFGHAAIYLTLISYAAVATVLSLGGENPVAFISVTRDQGVLLIQSWLLTLLATALPIAAMLMKWQDMQFELIRRNSGMHENLMMLDLSEQMAGIGRWRMDLVTGEQEWSQRMLEISGLPDHFEPNFDDLRELLPDKGLELIGHLARNRRAREPFTFDYKVNSPEKGERILRISVLNEFDITGRRIALFGIAMDVTEQVHRVQALDLARGQAMRLAAEAQKLANTDPLTNLPNRRCTFGRLESMVAVAAKHDSALTAIMFDIDHFKSINDQHGHQTGDEVIVQVAELARRQARQADVVGRIGGEEFVWLLAGVDARRARSLAERLRQAVESGIEGSPLPNVTISVGMAQFRAGDDGDELLARADAALYEAKEAGRNQVRRAA
ncbi:sensor domain-containing diguanylate cyclase [Aurantiacibacter sediminis]|uniref:diguanylate cyclase n=1 Tax=Aurantiacibacter sediminis TaxID=2793064 RepID=A0ABS0N4E6_9SPHN|nr:sensor domain-containing diguanylate cyclase [Aurantiacibacter sediminis]MBH5322150.1 diguanylate cyclase [Aurantiacibacter sediminis]